MDAAPSNKRFAEDLGVTFPLLSDFKRTVSEQYGILDSAKSLAVRTSYVIDKNGVVQHIEQGAEAIDPSGVGQMCDMLEHKQSGGEKK